MKPKITYFFSKGCHNCKILAPIINDLKTPLNINLVDTYQDSILSEEYRVMWVPTLIIEDENGKHKFEGPQEIKNVIKKIVL